MTPRAPDIRFAVDPADVPAEKAARRLHLTLDQFNAVLPRLLARGFPKPDPDTGMYGLEAIDQWRKNRDKLIVTLTVGASDGQPPPSPPIQGSGMGDRFRATKERTATSGRRHVRAS